MKTKIKFEFDDQQTELLKRACLVQVNCEDLLQSKMYMSMANEFDREILKFQGQWAKHLNKKYKPAPIRS